MIVGRLSLRLLLLLELVQTQFWLRVCGRCLGVGLRKELLLLQLELGKLLLLQLKLLLKLDRSCC